MTQLLSMGLMELRASRGEGCALLASERGQLMVLLLHKQLYLQMHKHLYSADSRSVFEELL